MGGGQSMENYRLKKGLDMIKGVHHSYQVVKLTGE